jgi:hypothetical protein
VQECFVEALWFIAQILQLYRIEDQVRYLACSMSFNVTKHPEKGCFVTLDYAAACSGRRRSGGSKSRMLAGATQMLQHVGYWVVSELTVKRLAATISTIVEREVM